MPATQPDPQPTYGATGFLRVVMAMVDGFTDRERRHSYAVFVVLYFFGNTNYHVLLSTAVR